MFGSKKDATSQLPVECLGIEFPSDEARRAYFLEKLREKLKDPGFRKIEGFPIGDDEDILALSDPTYYTACPNPFIESFLQQYSTKHHQDTANTYACCVLALAAVDVPAGVAATAAGTWL